MKKKPCLVIGPMGPKFMPDLTWLADEVVKPILENIACAKAIGVPAGEGAKHPANSGGIDASSHVIHYRLFPGVAAVVNSVTYPLQPS
jgi:hypothetical protein